MLFGYLLVAGVGSVNRPEDQHERVLVQNTLDDQPVTSCRYLRIDGLEAFLNEALATRYQQTSDVASHWSVFVVAGIDAHCLPAGSAFPSVPPGQLLSPTFSYRAGVPTASYQAINARPWNS